MRSEDNTKKIKTRAFRGVNPLEMKALNEIYYINKSIEAINRELAELREFNPYKKNIISDLPRGGERKDRATQYINNVMMLEDLLNYNLKKLQVERAKAEEIISKIKDPEIRLIVRLRCLNNMSWYKIGDEVGIDRRTASKKFYNYFEKCTECDT